MHEDYCLKALIDREILRKLDCKAIAHIPATQIIMQSLLLNRYSRSEGMRMI